MKINRRLFTKKEKGYFIFFFFLISFIFNFSQSNKLDELLNSNNLVVGKSKKNDTLSIFYHKYSDSFKKNKKYEQSIYFLNKSILVNNSSNTIGHKNDSIELSYLYLKINKPLKSISILNSINIESIKKYYYLGLAYRNIFDFEKAINNFKIVNYLITKNNSKNNIYLIKSLINISYCYLQTDKIENFNNGIRICIYADSIIEKNNIHWKYKFKFKLNHASFYNNNKNLNIKKSYKYYNDAYLIAKRNNSSFYVTATLLQIGNLYNTTNYKKSIAFLEKASIKCSKNDTLNLQKLHFFYSITYANNKEFKKSINSFQKSFHYLFNNKKSVYKNKSLFKNNHYKTLLYMLPMLAETYSKYYEETKNIKLLNKSIEYYKLADYVLDLVKNNSTDFNSKLFWQKMSSEIYGKAIKTCYFNNNIKDAFYFMEKNKALLLMEEIANQNYKLSLDVSNDLLEKENTIKKELIKIDNSQQNNQFSNDSIIKLRLDTEIKLEKFQDSIYNHKHIQHSIVKILNTKTIQHQLLKNEVFIEYCIPSESSNSIFESNKNGYGIFITKNNKKFVKIKKTNQLKTQIQRITKSLKKPFVSNNDITKFKELSFLIYDNLFPTLEIKKLIKNKKLTIAPDSYLSLLPFEALITHKTDQKKLNYLIENCEISYVYSYSFGENNKLSSTKNSSVLAMAPVQFKNDILSSLINSKQEIKQISNYFKCVSFTNNKATKKTFIKELSKHHIIHLATHANANDTINPWISFYEKKITLPELYLEKNNASLVVLSACNTTLGKEEIGEGIMSIARGFFNGGAQSVISSLWSVDDTATPYIMNAFYKNLYNNQTKSKALHNAKLQYLKNHTHSELSPHFWASFILIGKNNVVNIPFNYNYYFTFFAFFFFAFLGFYFYKRK